MSVALTPPQLKGDRFRTVQSVQPLGDSYRVRFAGVDSLDAAERTVGCYVLAAEDDLELDELDIAYDDLIDRAVTDDRYGDLGTIVEVMETPANDVWVVEGQYGEVLLPVIDDVVLAVPDKGAIRVHALDGLIDCEA